MKPWELAEVHSAKVFGGRRTPSSGNKWGFRGDVKTPIFLIEDKTTIHKSFSIPIKMWQKIRNEAVLEQRKPALQVTFSQGVSFVCIEESDFLEYIQMITKKEEDLLKL